MYLKAFSSWKVHILRLFLWKENISEGPESSRLVGGLSINREHFLADSASVFTPDEPPRVENWFEAPGPFSRRPAKTPSQLHTNISTEWDLNLPSCCHGFNTRARIFPLLITYYLFLQMLCHCGGRQGLLEWVLSSLYKIN